MVSCSSSQLSKTDIRILDVKDKVSDSNAQLLTFQLSSDNRIWVLVNLLLINAI